MRRNAKVVDRTYTLIGLLGLEILLPGAVAVHEPCHMSGHVIGQGWEGELGYCPSYPPDIFADCLGRHMVDHFHPSIWTGKLLEQRERFFQGVPVQVWLASLLLSELEADDKFIILGYIIDVGF